MSHVIKTGVGLLINNMSNVISLKDGKPIKFDSEAYRAYLLSLHKLDLLYEMSTFNDELQNVGHTDDMCEKGTILYNQMILVCQTPELLSQCELMLKYLRKTT